LQRRKRTDIRFIDASIGLFYTLTSNLLSRITDDAVRRELLDVLSELWELVWFKWLHMPRRDA
jgi:hypothetical protein